jgi:hypothetical protein
MTPLRPRFSLRTLAIVVTLVCAYFGAWEATKRWGIAQLPHSDGYPQKYSPLPFVVTEVGIFASMWRGPNRRYHLWLGPTIRLPFEVEGW